MGRIAVGVDGSGASRRALRWAIEEARLRGSGLDVVHTWSPDFMPWSSSMQPGLASAVWTDDVQLPPVENVRRSVRAALAEILEAEGLSETGDPPTRAVIVEGPSGPALVEAGRDADLLVVGARGLGEVRGIFLGSVSLHCVTHASGSVVVVRDGSADGDTADA
ncbi:MAG: universal stress protein [Acidimicrobiales bacterium]